MFNSEAAVTYSKSGTNIKGKNWFKKWCKSHLDFSTTYHRKKYEHVCNYLYTHSKETVSTQSIFIAILAMNFGYVFKGHIKIDSRNRLN